MNYEDTQNEESQDTSDVEANTQDNELGTTEEAHEETAKATTDEATQKREPESDEAKRARLTRQLKQLEKKLGKPAQEDGKKGQESTQEVDERYDRLELKTEGVKDRAEQDIVIDYARYKKISVADALNTPAVQAELRALQAKTSTPSPSTRTNTSREKSVEYWVEQVKKGKPNSTDPAIRSQVRAILQKELT